MFHVIKDNHRVNEKHMDVIHTGIIGSGRRNGFEVFDPVPTDISKGSPDEAWQSRPINKSNIPKNLLNRLHRLFTSGQFGYRFDSIFGEGDFVSPSSDAAFGI